MPRLMSFALTTPQFIDRSKTVTRRMGWANLRPGETVQGCEKAMGLRRGEKVKRLNLIRILSVRPEPLNAITQDDVIKEGFPDMTSEDFIAMFTKHNMCKPDKIVNRIEYEYL